jgi:hypothetical protein
MVNRRPYDQYFPDLLRRNDLMAPFLGGCPAAGGWWLHVCLATDWVGGGRATCEGNNERCLHAASSHFIALKQVYNPCWHTGC